MALPRASSERVVDSHVHIWPRGLVHPAQRGQAPLEATAADLLVTLDRSGVAAAFASPAMVYPENAYVLGAAGAVPRRLRAVVGIDPRDSGGPLSVEGHAALGAIAIRVNLGTSRLDSPEALSGLDALVDATASSGLVLQWTMRLSSSALIERVAARHARLTQVFDHLGLPDDAHDLTQLDRIRDLAAIPALNIKLSGMYALSSEGYPYRDVWPWMDGAIEAFGTLRTLWASDWPLSTESASHAQLLGLVRSLPFLDEGGCRQILAGTADRLWPPS
jgi:predicted TIM-barrel fold metal-dependent hydrolase